MCEPQIKKFKIADIRWKIDTDLDKAIANLHDLKLKYEAEGYSKLELDVNYEDEYGSISPCIDFYGHRFETEKEVEIRENYEKINAKRQEAHDRRQLEALKKKLGEK